MSGAQHTPGPWEFLPDSRIVAAPSIWRDDEGQHCDMRYPRIIAELPDDWDQAEHGRLLAAAPELLEALDEAYAELAADSTRDGPRCLLLTKIEAAIAKAKGGAA